MWAVPGGPKAEDSLQSRQNVARAEAALPKAVLPAVETGTDAIVINCLRDPGVDLLRELIDVPVIGLAEAAMCMAGLLGRSFGFLVNEERGIQVVEEQARKFGRAEAFVGARPLDIAVDRLHELETADVVAAMADVAQMLIEQDRADVVVLGCTALSPYIGPMRVELTKRGLPRVPVIEPTELGVRLAEMMCDLGLQHSRRSYPDSRRYSED